eukprot:UN08283
MEESITGESVVLRYLVGKNGSETEMAKKAIVD